MYRDTPKYKQPAKDADHYGKRQPRPAPRKQGTRKGAVLAARREAGV